MYVLFVRIQKSLIKYEFRILSSNALEGDIPSELSSMTSLEQL